MDEFNTVNVGRQQMARELEVLKQRYLGHRETLVRLEADAPSEELAARYRALQQEIDTAVHKLNELASAEPPKRTQPASGRVPAMVAPVTAASSATAAPATPPPSTASIADRPLHAGARTPAPPVMVSAPEASEDKKRLIYIVSAAVLMLMILGLLVWRSRRNDAPKVVEAEPAVVATATEPPVESVADSGDLTVNPASHDFGTIRKGTRAVRQFRIENASDQAVSVSIDRSTCRCLWFDFDSSIPAKSSSILAITVDGAKAKAGRLEEDVTIKNKGDASDTTTIRLVANIE